jgi:hypothetical protein
MDFLNGIILVEVSGHKIEFSCFADFLKPENSGMVFLKIRTWSRDCE